MLDRKGVEGFASHGHALSLEGGAVLSGSAVTLCVQTAGRGWVWLEKRAGLRLTM